MKQNYREKLRPILDTYCDPVHHFHELVKNTEAYKLLQLELTAIDLEEEQLREDIQLATGTALGTTWAARCVDDLIRTKQFVKGLTEGVEWCLARQKKPVHILYAGTGPFAALVLPLLSRYSPAELQLSLMEINAASYAFVQKVFQEMSAEDYVSNWIHADATTYQLPSPAEIDILLSETMQNMLKKEQQVPIVWHLLRQLPADVLLIPEVIELSLALDYGSGGQLPEYSYTRLGKIFTLDKTIAEVQLVPGQTPMDLDFSTKVIRIPGTQITDSCSLRLLTEIQVFGDTYIRLNESGLTTPRLMADLKEWQDQDLEIKARYQIGDHPQMIINLNPALTVTN